jgi:hypothetical protein
VIQLEFQDLVQVSDDLLFYKRRRVVLSVFYLPAPLRRLSPSLDVNHAVNTGSKGAPRPLSLPPVSLNEFPSHPPLCVDNPVPFLPLDLSGGGAGRAGRIRAGPSLRSLGQHGT